MVPCLNFLFCGQGFAVQGLSCDLERSLLTRSHGRKSFGAFILKELRREFAEMASACFREAWHDPKKNPLAAVSRVRSRRAGRRHRIFSSRNPSVPRRSSSVTPSRSGFGNSALIQVI